MSNNYLYAKIYMNVIMHKPSDDADEFLRNHFLDSFKRMLAIAISHLGVRQDAEDLLQDLYVELWKGRNKFQLSQKPKAYLFTALKYHIFKYINNKYITAEHIDYIDELWDITVDKSDVENYPILSFDEIYDKIEEAIDNLPPQCKIVFRKRYIEGFSAKEVSEQTGLSTSTVNNHSHRALKKIRYAVKDYAPIIILFLIDCK